METIIEYKCEICGKRYSDVESAIECEKKGVFDKSKFPAIGTMFEYHHNGYVGIFSIALVKPNKESGTHFGRTAWWAARTPKYPLGVGFGNETMCGGYDFNYSSDKYVKTWIEQHFITTSKVDTTEFERVVKFLKSQKIKPCYYTKSGELIYV